MIGNLACLAAVSALCSCSLVTGWMSEPVEYGHSGKTAVVMRPKGLRAVSKRDLNFQLKRFPDRVDVTISSGKWKILGCGSGTSEAVPHGVVIHSVAGVRDPAGGSSEFSWTCRDGRKEKVFFRDNDGDETEIE